VPARERGDPPQDSSLLAGITLDTEAMGIDPTTGWPLPERAQKLAFPLRRD
jgi:hypothetical protein